jgi:putative aldouronate transport system substrate-binding protein
MSRATLRSRRAVLRLAAGAFALGGVALLEACGPSSAPAPTAAPAAAPTTPPAQPTSVPAAAKPTTAPASVATSAPTTAAAAAPPAQPTVQPGLVPGQLPISNSVAMPTRVPITGVTADLPGSADGLVDPGFVNYPANPFKAVTETPGSGGDVSVATWTLAPPPPPVDQNALWQAVNKELNVNLKLDISALADYQTTRLATIIAGNDLPDILYIAPQVAINGLTQFLQAKCVDLTQYLSGDAVKDYPNLANFTTLAWQSVVFGKAIYGVPASYPLFLWVHWVHGELMDKDGLQPPKNLDDYATLLKHFTNPQQDFYGLATENNVGYGITNGFFTAMYGLPNNWGLSNGKLTYYLEDPRTKDATNKARELYAAGVYSPNSTQYNTGNKRTDFAGRKFAFNFDGFQGASLTFFSTAAGLNPPAQYRMLSPFPAVAGQQPTFWAQQGTFGYSVLKKASDDRIKELLRVLNYIASPFGSQEYRLMRYGVEGVDYNPDDKGNPVLTTQGKADTTIPWQYITQPPAAMYLPGNPQYPQIMQDAEKAMLPYAQIDPTSTLYSPTYASKGTVLNQMVATQIGEIVLGRADISSYDKLVSDWKSQGGDQIRSEFEQAIAAS